MSCAASRSTGRCSPRSPSRSRPSPRPVPGRPPQPDPGRPPQPDPGRRPQPDPGRRPQSDLAVSYWPGAGLGRRLRARPRDRIPGRAGPGRGRDRPVRPDGRAGPGPPPGSGVQHRLDDRAVRPGRLLGRPGLLLQADPHDRGRRRPDRPGRVPPRAGRRRPAPAGRARRGGGAALAGVVRRPGRRVVPLLRSRLAVRRTGPGLLHRRGPDPPPALPRRRGRHRARLLPGPRPVSSGRRSAQGVGQAVPPFPPAPSSPICDALSDIPD
jgi:hypothetical protein